MVFDVSSSLVVYLFYSQGCIKFDTLFSSLVEISLMFHWVILYRTITPLHKFPKTLKLSNSLNDERKRMRTAKVEC